MKNLVIMQRLLDSHNARSAWSKGVKVYAAELLHDLCEGVKDGYIDPDCIDNFNLFTKAILNGASDWTEYSWGGCSLIYDNQIATRLCNPSELKKTGNGSRRPNKNEAWLDVQARALYQASMILWNIAKEVK